MKFESVNLLFHGTKAHKKAPLRRYIEAGLSPPFGFALATSMGWATGRIPQPDR
jgi:hypothetical protein